MLRIDIAVLQLLACSSVLMTWSCGPGQVSGFVGHGGGGNTDDDTSPYLLSVKAPGLTKCMIIFEVSEVKLSIPISWQVLSSFAYHRRRRY